MLVQNSILLVEDSPEDREATVRALKKAGVANPIYFCSNGDHALEYLFRRGQYANADLSPRPSVILLDLNMPGTDGREVLAEVKKTDHLKSIPIVVLTTSTDKRDIRPVTNRPNSYIKKPVDLEGFLKSVQCLKEYWLEVVILPK